MASKQKPATPDPQKKELLAKTSLEKSIAYADQYNFGRAFAHYLVYLKLMPQEAPEHEHTFAGILYQWGTQLQEEDRLDDFCKSYLQAMELYPNSAIIYSNFGGHLIGFGGYEAAKRYLQKALTCDSNFLPAEKNLLAVKLQLVPRWHFRMLNDRLRNDAYRKAILKCIDYKYNKVVDIGSGSGILSLIASKSPNVKRVVAIEESKVLHEIAKNVFISNKVNNKVIRNLRRLSIDLKRKEVRANLLVTEIFDAAFFGEHVLETMVHAWQNILNKDSKIIPASADIYVTGINSPEMIKNFKITEKIPGIDLLKYCTFNKMCVEYDAEKLTERRLKYVTKTEKIAHVDFYNVKQLNQMLSEPRFLPPIKLECIENSTLHAFAIWFDLNLDDEITISTNPNADKNRVHCWEQAVIYPLHSLGVKKNQTIVIRPSITLSCLRISIENETAQCKRPFPLSQPFICCANETNFNAIIHEIAQSLPFNANTVAFDLNPFPLFAILMAKKGVTSYTLTQYLSDYDFLLEIKNSEKIHMLNSITRDFYSDIDLDNVFRIDYLFVNPIGRDGTLKEHGLSDMACLREKLHPNAQIFPRKVNVIAQIISSKYLEECNKINDNNLFGFNISRHFKEYVVLEQPYLNAHFPHAKLSKPFKITDVLEADLNFREKSVEIPIVQSGWANAILYWFEYDFSDTLKFETIYSSYFNIASFLFPVPRKVVQKDTIKVTFKQNKGQMSLFCE